MVRSCIISPCSDKSALGGKALKRGGGGGEGIGKRERQRGERERGVGALQRENPREKSGTLPPSSPVPGRSYGRCLE